jgi:large conductance mechanosensitive channel
VVSFVIIALVLFFAVKALNRFKREEEPTHRDCPFCLTSVPVAATRCPACTSQLEK